LSAMEVVLGIDNVVFISLMVSRMHPEQRLTARRVGLLLALIFRIIMLGGIAYIIHLTTPLFSFAGYDFSWRDLILIAGGLFLLVKGTREMRSILIRDPNKMIAAAVLSSPKLTTAEVERFARMTSVSDDVLRTIAQNRSWMKQYGVIAGLTKNPKTPVGLSLRLVSRLNAKDLNTLAVDRNIPGALRNAARKRVAGATGDD